VRSAARLVPKSWDDKDDEYTTWMNKWTGAMVPKSEEKAGKPS